MAKILRRHYETAAERGESPAAPGGLPEKASSEDRPWLVKTFLRYEREGNEADGLENEPGPPNELPKEREERILRSLAQCLWDNAPLYILEKWDDLAKKGEELDDL